MTRAAKIVWFIGLAIFIGWLTHRAFGQTFQRSLPFLAKPIVTSDVFTPITNPTQVPWLIAWYDFSWNTNVFTNVDWTGPAQTALKVHTANDLFTNNLKLVYSSDEVYWYKNVWSWTNGCIFLNPGTSSRFYIYDQGGGQSSWSISHPTYLFILCFSDETGDNYGLTGPFWNDASLNQGIDVVIHTDGTASKFRTYYGIAPKTTNSMDFTFHKDVWTLLTFCANGVNSFVRTNGVLETAGPLTNTTMQTGLMIGDAETSNLANFGGLVIAELWYGGGTLTTNQIKAVEHYMATTYTNLLSLPAP